MALCVKFPKYLFIYFLKIKIYDRKYKAHSSVPIFTNYT